MFSLLCQRRSTCRKYWKRSSYLENSDNHLKFIDKKRIPFFCQPLPGLVLGTHCVFSIFTLQKLKICVLFRRVSSLNRPKFAEICFFCSLHKMWENTWILSLYGRILVSENRYSRIFDAVINIALMRPVFIKYALLVAPCYFSENKLSKFWYCPLQLPGRLHCDSVARISALKYHAGYLLPCQKRQ